MYFIVKVNDILERNYFRIPWLSGHSVHYVFNTKKNKHSEVETEKNIGYAIIDW